MQEAPRTLVELAQRQARHRPSKLLYTFLTDGERPAATLTYGGLDRRARSIAAELHQRGLVGQRALLLYPPGLEFIAAFFGCLYAGTVAVPAYPPRPHRDLQRLCALVADAGAAAALTTGALSQRLSHAPELPQLAWLATDDLLPAESEEAVDLPPVLDRDALAFLQYTSGSTTEPRGVMVCHRHLLHNQRLIRRAFDHSEDTVVASWLPLYHDMGLIGSVLQPLYTGGSCVLMSPVAFLQQPLRWLRAIERYRATTSGGPDFGYQLCLRRITPEQAAELDLSSWRVAFNGAEPVRAATLEAFSQRFAVAGFRHTAFFPCYGLAEATLFVSGPKAGQGPVIRHFAAAELARGRAVAAGAAEPASRALVSCGRVPPEQQLQVVDPESRQPCPEGTVGELWLAGGSVTDGYWQRLEASAETFQARLAASDRNPSPRSNFLRTGDLGFVCEGELYVTGRRKDLIIVRGRNHYPQDLERSAEASHPGLVAGGAAAFSVDHGEREQLGLVLELTPSRRAPQPAELAAIRSAVLQALAEEHELEPELLALVPAGTIPRTSSGKIRRQECRRRLLAGELASADCWTRPAPEADVPPEGEQDAIEDTTAWLLHRTAQILGHATAPDPDLPLTRYGLDSLAAIELQHAVETRLGVQLDVAELLGGQTLRQLAASLSPDASRASAPPPASPGPDAGTETSTGEEPARRIAAESFTGDPQPLAPGQRALFFLQQLQGQSSAYNVFLAAAIPGPVDRVALRHAGYQLLARHGSLRTRFRLRDGTPVQQVLATSEAPLDLQVRDATALAAELLQRQLVQAAHEPFDLEGDVLLRLRLWRRTDGDDLLLVVVHHLVADLWSLAVLLRDLAELYTAIREQRSPQLPPAPAFLPEAQRQAELLAGPRGEQQWQFWQRTLAKLPLPLPLPTDRPRPAVQTERGGRWLARLPAATTAALHQLGRHGLATLYMVLVAAFEVWLHRLTGRRHFLLGTLANGRQHARRAQLVGYLVNPLVLPAAICPGSSFARLLQHVRATALEVYRHQDFPFSTLVERLQPPRDPSRSPLFQVLLSLQQVPLGGGAAAAAFALGSAGAELQLSGLRLRSVDLAPKTAQFDLSLMIAETGDGLLLSWQYNADLFDATTIRRGASQLNALLAQMVAAPELPLERLRLLTPAQSQQLLREHNDTLWPPGDGGPLVPELIAAQAHLSPEVVAVRLAAGPGGEPRELSYRQLDERARDLAGHLRALGAGPETRVGIAMERSLELVVGLVGILYSGAAYVPLDPDAPSQRLAALAAGADLTVVLVQAPAPPGLAEVATLPLDPEGRPPAGGRPHRAPLPALAAEGLAYVIYTSGSTGQPKGAMNRHAGLRNRLRWMQAAYPLGAADRVLQKTVFTFDVSVWEFFWPLMTGARLVLAPPGSHRDAAELARLVAAEGITVMHFVPSLLELFLAQERLRLGTALARVIASGEALSPALAERFFMRLPYVALENLYGPTEAAIDVTAWHCRPGAPRVPIGRPIANTRIHLLALGPSPLAVSEPTPPGVPGELAIAGINLARGYLGAPRRTAERFVPDPFAADSDPSPAGGRLYRTGDLARWLPGGELHFLGRLDDQVKVHGIRVEPGEIETALQSHPAVREVVVLLRCDRRASADAGSGEPTADGIGDLRRFSAGSTTSEAGARLVAYLTCRHTQPIPSVSELRRFLGQSLPAPLIPASFVVLEQLPLTASGKVDRRRLPAPGGQRPQLAVAFTGPRGSRERDLAEVWSQVLGLAPIGIDDNFFELGGDSIRTLQVRAALEQRGWVVSLELLYRHQSIRQLAPELRPAVPAEDALLAALREPEAPPEAAPRSLLSIADRRRLPVEVEDAYPLTATQAGILFHSQFEPETPLYRDIFLCRLRGPCDPQLLRTAAQQSQDRHPMLRTSFDLAGFEEALQLVHRSVPVHFEVEVLAGAEDLGHTAVAAWLEGEKARTVDWQRPPLVRFFILRLAAADNFAVALSFYDALLDGWSTSSLLTEWLRRYDALLAGQPGPPLEPPPVSFRQFVALERAAVRSPEQRAFWQQALADCTALHLPRWRPPQGTPRIGVLSLPLPAATAEALQRLARDAGATLKHALLAAHLKVLSLLQGGPPDVLTGIESSARPEQPGSAATLGMHVNVLPLRLRLRPGSWRDLVAQSFAAEQELLPFRRFPLVEAQRLVGHKRLLETLFNFTHFHVLQQLEGLRHLHPQEASGFDQTSFTLRADFQRNPLTGALGLNLVADLSQISGTQLRALRQRYAEVLRAMIADPAAPHHRAGLLTTGELQLLREHNDTATALPAVSALHQLIAAQAEQRPDAIAVVGRRHQTSYAHLDATANRLARYLEPWVARGEVVGLCLRRSTDLLVALLAVHKAGAAYLPLDPRYPLRRLSFLLADSGVRMLITEQTLLGRLLQARGADEALPCHMLCLDADRATWSRQPAQPPARPVHPDHLAYLLYTSGSTGQPKGVQICHRALLNLQLALCQQPGLSASDSLLAITTLSFDISVVELLVPLTLGARVVLADDGTITDGHLLATRLTEQRATVMQGTPITWRLLLESGWPHGDTGATRRLRMLCGGETMTQDLAQELAARGRALWNLYGPTETTVWSSCQRVASGEATIAIGRPLANTRLDVVDHEGNLLPPGLAGELCIGGLGLARGYLGRPGLTAERFRPDPAGSQPGDRRYHTGDLVRRLPDGRLEFAGRLDHQVKLHGHRIELGEIEAALESHPLIQGAAVVVHRPAVGHPRLAAYFVPAGDAALPPRELRSFLLQSLPQYMIPAFFLPLASLPKTPNGKIDRRRLPEPKAVRPNPERLLTWLEKLESLSDEQVQKLLASGTPPREP